LQAEFSGVEGYSPRSLKYARLFADAWQDMAIIWFCWTGDFLTVSKRAHEREIKRGLLSHLQDLLLKLGRGFTFVGSQVPLDAGDETFFLDLSLNIFVFIAFW
jgi:predicted nuclease of restriction endonuclease-like (RecB) superfamily